MANDAVYSEQIWAVVPVKQFERAKSRLELQLPILTRIELARAMVTDVLDVLSRVGELAGVLTVTCDDQVAALALAYGSEVLSEREPTGTNNAVMSGMNHIIRKGGSGVIIIHSDIPYICVREVRTVLESLKAHRVVIVPAQRDGGTNILAISPIQALVPSFGIGSSMRHVSLARVSGIEPEILQLNGAAHDIDVFADLAHVPPTNEGWRTRAVLDRFFSGAYVGKWSNG